MTAPSTDPGFADAVRANQRRLAERMRATYDFIVCGSGSSGSVVAARLAEDPDAQVLLLEAGGPDDVPEVMEPERWVENLGSDRDWNYAAEPSIHVDGRSVPMDTGRTLGGGSSINVMVWSRGHRADWDRFAAETGDPGWGYEAVLALYRRIETYVGAPDPERRGAAGPMHVAPCSTLQPVNAAVLDAAREIGIPRFPDPNGAMMEAGQGCAAADLIVRDGRRRSVFRSYVHPVMDRPNLTVLTGAHVRRVTFEGCRATGVEVSHRGAVRRIGAACEVVLSAGAINTPKLLMHSGIGEATHLASFGIPVVQHLPGVGQNLQDHAAFGRMWRSADVPWAPSTLAEAVVFARTGAARDAPDVVIFPMLLPFASPETMARYRPPADCFTLVANVLHPRSRGRVRLTGADPSDPLRIEPGYLADPDDVRAAMEAMRICQDLGDAPALRRVSGAQVAPGDLGAAELEDYVRNDCTNFRHQTCTAKMGRDAMSVVDAGLRVHGLDGLRIADGSVLPRITTGNTMAPCVVMGERASDLIRRSNGLVP